MATYREIHGVKVQYRDSDATAVEGDIWYNRSTGLLKMYASLGSWATGNDANGASLRQAGFGTQTAAVKVGGNSPGANCELYDGSSWTEVANLTTGRMYLSGAGTTTAGLAFGGLPAPIAQLSEEWNGASWAEGDDLNTDSELPMGLGTQTAALCCGAGPGGGSTKVEQYDGSSWTEIADLNTARSTGATTGRGTTTDCLTFGGWQAPGTTRSALTEAFNGTSWTEVGDMGTARYYNGGAGTSTTSAITFGGAVTDPPGANANTESYDGSSWSEVGDLNVGRRAGSAAGTSTSALYFCGYPSPPGALTEEWDMATTVETVAFD